MSTLTVAIGVSAFINDTPVLVMTAAGYTFRDFVKVGLPLVIMMLSTLSYLLARHYGL